MSCNHPTAHRAAAITDEQWSAWLESRPEQQHRAAECGLGAALVENELHTGIASSPSARLSALALVLLGVQTAASFAFDETATAMLQFMLPALMLLEGARAWIMASEVQKLKSRGLLDEIAVTPGGPESLVAALARSWGRARLCAVVVHGVGMAILGTAFLLSDGTSPYLYLGVLAAAFVVLAIASPSLFARNAQTDVSHVEDAAIALAPPSIAASAEAACRPLIPLLFIPVLVIVALPFAGAAFIAVLLQTLDVALVIAALGTLVLLGGTILAGCLARKARRSAAATLAQRRGSVQQQFQNLLEGR